MNISSISFGKKIPISNCQVIDKEQNKPIEATLYEYDCKDLFDVYDVGDLDDTWNFRDILTSMMHSKYLKFKIKKQDDSLKFYCMKNNKNETLGLCQTKEYDNKDIDVKIITTSRAGKYKYVGQAILSQLAQKVLNSGGNILQIKGALPGTREYYENSCGFKYYQDEDSIVGCKYKLEGSELSELSKRTEEKIKLYV